VRRASVVTALVALGGALAAHDARAALTASEEVVVRQYVQQGALANVSRVRAVVARPDLSADESADAMVHALAPTQVTDARVAFLRELVFGAGSQASRSVLALAVTRGLVARADEILNRATANADDAAELFRIYALLDASIANAGSPTMRNHDAQAGIDGTTYEAAARALGDHLKRHATLQPGSPLSPAMSRVRAQAMLATFDMGADSPTRVIDGADRIGLDATRKALLLERGVLLLDAGSDAQRAASAAALVRRFRASALERVEAIFFGSESGLHARGQVVAVKDDSALADGFPADEVTASTVSAPLSSLAGQLAFAVAQSALQGHGDLRLAVQRDAGTDAKRWLGASDATPEGIAASALRMLLVDAPRTIDLAMARFLVNRPESAALVSDAIGVLAASAGPDGVQSLVLGRGEADGTTSPLPLSAVRLNPSGTAAGFTLGGARWEIARDASGVVTGVRRDGQPLVFTILSHAHIPVAGGASWSGGGLALTALYGSPLVGVVSVNGSPQVRLVAQGDLDAAKIQAPGDDVAFDADVRAEGPFEILLRAESPTSLGMGLRVVPGSPTKIALVNRSGGEREVAQSTALASVEHVHVEVRGTTMRALCTHRGAGTPQNATLEAPVPAHQAHGDVALVVKKGSSVHLSAIALRRN